MMDVATELHLFIYDLVDVRDYFEEKEVPEHHVSNQDLAVVHKASKQLSDLCWQEIQRRRRRE